MQANRRLSLVIAILLVVQLLLPYGSWQQNVTAATLGPVVVSTSPSNAATNIGLRPTLRVTFDQNIVKKDNSKRISIYRYSDNAVVQSLPMSDSKVTISNNVLSARLGSDLSLSTDYYVLIDAGAVANASNGALFAGISDPSLWNFKTTDVIDNVKPTLVSNGGLCPATGSCSTYLSITDSITFTFDEPVYVASGSITLVGTSDNRTIPVTSSEITGSGTTAITITPSTPLRPSTLYALTITSSNITDASGNAFNGGNWRFYTNESPVKLVSSSPSNGATNVNLSSNIELVFDQNVAASGSKRVQIRNAASNELVFNEYANSSRISIVNNVVTIDPASNFARDSYFYVTIEPGAFYAHSKPADIYYGISNATELRFQTGAGNDNTPPSISTYLPARGASSVGTTEKINLTFNENVYVKNGTVEIREYNSGTLYRSIDITSSRITGGGTKVITIDPHSSKGEGAKSFTLGTRYYVTITKDAIVDAAGNAYPGISSKSTYYFTVGTTQTGPQLVSLSPVNLSTTVPTNAVFKLTFDKPVVVDPLSDKVTITNIKNAASSITGTLRSSSSDNKVIEITPDETLLGNNDYYINVENNSIFDLGGNYFVGIKNEHQWRFKTLGGDVSPPVMVKTEVSGNVVRLVYNELLNENVVPSPAQYYVTVGGNARNVSSVKITGNVVFVTLASAVSSNQQVLISYTRGTVSQIQDITGNIGASFANIAAVSGFTESNPVVKSSSFNGSTITLTFSENLDTLHSLAFTQFTVTVNGKANTINRISQSNNSLVLTVSNSMTSKDTVVVNYSPGLYPIVGLSNNKVAAFNHTVGTGTSTGGSGGNNTVTGAPTLQYIALSGENLLLKYNESLYSSSTPETYQYFVQINGKAATIRSVLISGDTVLLNITDSMKSSDAIYVTYYGTTTTLLDRDYNAAASFASKLVTGPTGGSDEEEDEETGEVSVQGAILRGDTLTINFSGKLDAGSVPSTSSFLVIVADNSRVISNVSINGSQAILKLSSPAKVGEYATVSYFNTGGTLRSSSGTAINVFTNLSVANQTTLADSLSTDYAEAANGLIIKPSASTQSSDVSPGGYSVNRYTINNEKLNTAISTLSDAQMKNAKIIFEVPASERAAIVVYPVASLDYALRKGDFTLVVKHGTKTYELPISAIDITAATKALSGNSSTNQVKLVIEEGQTPATSSLVTAINRSGATLLEGPFYYDTLVVNGTRSESAKIKGNLKRTIQTNRSLTNSSTAVVFYDSVVGQISYVPTTFSKSGSTTTVEFNRSGNSAYALVSSNKSFSDSANHWGLSSISTMTRKFIADGHSGTNFNPKTKITRGEFATYIVRGLGLSADKDAAKQFKDVNSNSVMGGYIGAAAKSGIVSGVSNDSFAPNNYITRQDMALMMIRAANYVGLNTKLSGTSDSVLAGFKDKASVSPYAKSGLAQAIQLGIISGTSNTTLSPKDNAERVQGIIMIQRLLEQAGYLQK